MRHRDRWLRWLSTYIKYLLCARHGLTCAWRGFMEGVRPKHWPIHWGPQSSVKWGQYFLCSWLWGLEINSIVVHHRSYSPGAERHLVHVYKWWTKIRQSFMRDERCKQNIRKSAGRDESRMGSWESVFWLSLERWAGYWQDVRGRAIPHGRKAVRKARCPLFGTQPLEPSLPLSGPH